jgi:hypothetical protein
VFEYSSERAPSTALRVASDTRTGYEALEAALLAELGDEMRDYAIVWGDACAAAVFDPELRAHAQKITRVWRDTICAAIVRGVSDGSIREDVDPVLTAEHLVTLIEGYSVRWLAETMELDMARQMLSETLLELKAPRAPESG